MKYEGGSNPSQVPPPSWISLPQPAHISEYFRLFLDCSFGLISKISCFLKVLLCVLSVFCACVEWRQLLLPCVCVCVCGLILSLINYTD